MRGRKPSRVMASQGLGQWGVLQGVRPVKLAHKLLAAGLSLEELPAYLEEVYGLSQVTAQLLAELCRRQQPLLGPYNGQLALYLHIPFCPSRCSYCSFPAGLVPEEEKQENFLNLIEQDIESVVELLGMRGGLLPPASALYVGGGTPTSLALGPFTKLLRLLRRAFGGLGLKEFTVEAGRPDTIDEAKLAVMAAAGVTRLCVNPQTLQPATLLRIGRGHSLEAFYTAYEAARRRGFLLNVDLIVGLPGEGREQILDSIKGVLALEPDNLTLHTLALKRGSSLFHAFRPEESLGPEEAEAVVEAGMALCRRQGLQPYYLYRQHYMLGSLANIGYARPGRACLYNVLMMEEQQPVLGLGPGAVSKLPLPDTHHLRRLAFPKDVATYAAGLPRLLTARQRLFLQAGRT